MRSRTRRPRVARLATFLCPFALALLSSNGAQAFEQGMSIYPKGFAGVMSGFIPPQPGLFILNPYYYHFSGTTDAIVRDGEVELGVDMRMDAIFVQGFYVTDWKLFGGNYSFGGAVAYAWADISATATGPLGNTVDISAANSDVANSIIMPLNLSWHSGNWHTNAGLSIYVPTGLYSRGNLNIGRNMWALIPTLAVTWFDMANGWDVSGSFAFVIPGENDATDYQSGVVFQADWCDGQAFGCMGNRRFREHRATDNRRQWVGRQAWRVPVAKFRYWASDSLHRDAWPSATDLQCEVAARHLGHEHDQRRCGYGVTRVRVLTPIGPKSNSAGANGTK